LLADIDIILIYTDKISTYSASELEGGSRSAYDSPVAIQVSVPLHRVDARPQS
jgi:hypothetical protein